MISVVFLVVLVLLCTMTRGVAAKSMPVVFMHGIAGQATDWEGFMGWITEVYPDTYTKILEVGDDPKKDSTFADFNVYLENIAEQIKADPMLKDGFVFAGHSQGGLLARAYVEMYNDPPVRRLLTLSSPHGGIYCAIDGGCWIPVSDDFMSVLEYITSEFLYTDYFQDNFMAAAYWRDPFMLEEYYSMCRGLPYYNNEIDYNESYRNNFRSLEKVKLIWSDIDEIIVPNESAKFQYFKKDTEELYGFEETPLFQQDLIGLKELYENGKVEFANSHMLHNGYRFNHEFFENELLDFLHVDM